MRDKNLFLKTLLLFMAVFIGNFLFAQNVAVNATGEKADNSAILDVKHANKGMLVPRVSLMDNNDKVTIPVPATSLLVYNINKDMIKGEGEGYYYNSSTPADPLWVKLAITTTATNAWLIHGNDNIIPGLHFVGTTNDQDVVFKRNDITAFEIKPGGTLLATGNGSGLTPALPNGFGMVWSSNKRAFRTGTALNDEWTDNNVGDNSIAAGYNSKASGGSSVAFGENAVASATAATALGNYTTAEGAGSLTAGISTKASGEAATAVGIGTIASKNYATALGSGTTADGIAAIAGGEGASATAQAAIAFGYNSKASKNYSSALGYKTTADGIAATALGDSSIAKGKASLAAGLMSKAEGNYSLAIGNEANTSTGGVNAIALGSKSTAQNESAVAIGHLNIALGKYSSAIGYSNYAETEGTFAAGYNNTVIGSRAVSLGDNNRSIGIASFTAGSYDTAQGNYSAAIGYKNLATGNYSFASGSNTTAEGSNSVSINNATYAKGMNSLAAGESTNAAGKNSVALGFNTNTLTNARSSFAGGENSIAAGIASFSFGSGTLANENYAVAFGSQSKAYGISSAAIGNNTLAVGDYSTAIGISSNAGAYGSFAVGYNTAAKSRYSTVVGMYNDLSDFPDEANSSPNDRIFQVGVGTSENDRRNALTVLKKGRIGINETSPISTLHIKAIDKDYFEPGNLPAYAITVESPSARRLALKLVGDNYFRIGIGNNQTIANFSSNGDNNGDGGTLNVKNIFSTKITADELIETSDIRLKNNIFPLQNVLKKLNHIQPIFFNYNKSIDRSGEDRHIGFSAQEVQKQFPELVRKNQDGYLGVNYANMSAVLLQAIKEQQQIIDNLTKRIDEKDKENTEFKNQLQQVVERLNKLEQK